MLVVSDTASPEGDHWDEAWEMASALARDHDVILALPAATSHTHRDFAVIYYNQRNLGLVAKDSEAVVSSADIIAANTFFTSSGSIVTANASQLRRGILAGDSETTPAAPGVDGYYIWIPAEEKPGHGPKHTIKKLRYYMHKGGIRYTARRAFTSLKWRLGFGR